MQSAVQHILLTLKKEVPMKKKGAHHQGIEDPQVQDQRQKNAQSITLTPHWKATSIPPILNTFPRLHSMANLWCLQCRLRGQEDLFVSHRNDGGQWSVATPLESSIHPTMKRPTASVRRSNTIVFTMCNNKTTGFGSCDLYYAF